MFASKKEAEAHDKMLELGEQFTSLLNNQIAGIDKQKAEEFGILLAKNKEIIMAACKGNPEALEKITQQEEENNVTPLVAESGA